MGIWQQSSHSEYFCTRSGKEGIVLTERWQTVIEPKTKLLDIPLKEVSQYRGMIYMLVKRNYQIQYKQTILGPLWIILGTVFSTGLMSFIFGYVGHFPTDGIPYFLFYLPGSLLWGFFSACMNSNSRVFLENAYLFGKVYFPRLVVPASNVVFIFIRFLLQMAVFFCVWLFYFISGGAAFMGLYLLLVPVLVLHSALLGTAIGLFVSSMTTKYRDMSHLVGFGMQLMMYAAPVMYSMNELSPILQKLILLNPMASVIEAFRFCLTGSGTIHWGALVYSFAATVLAMIGSLILFNQTEKDFIDII